MTPHSAANSTSDFFLAVCWFAFHILVPILTAKGIWTEIQRKKLHIYGYSDSTKNANIVFLTIFLILYVIGLYIWNMYF